MNVSVVVPCFRSADTLPELVRRIEETMRPLAESGTVTNFEILLVVDGGPNDTATTAVKLQSRHQAVGAILLRRNFGQHNALIAGIRAAQFGTIVTLDDDLQHPPEEIPKVLAALQAGVDLVYGVSDVEEHGSFRSLSSRLVKRALVLAGVAHADWVSAFRAFRTDLREEFAGVTDSQVNLDVLLGWTTSRVKLAVISMNRRQRGRSSYGAALLLRHSLNMVTGFSIAPLRAASWLGLIAALIGFALLVWGVVRYAAGATTLASFTTIAALISLFAGIQLLTIGIIGEYVGRQHLRNMNRPMYSVIPKSEEAD